MEDEKTYENEPDTDLRNLLVDLSSAQSSYYQFSKETSNSLLQKILSDSSKRKELQMIEIKKSFGVKTVNITSSTDAETRKLSKSEILKNCMMEEKALLKHLASLLSGKIGEVQRFILNNHKQDTEAQVGLLGKLSREFSTNS